MKYKELENCTLCPRECGINRYENIGFCKAGCKIKAARAFLHMWEEPCISGESGSGTIFFSNCNLNCVFCQNYEISHDGIGKEISENRLTDIMLELQKSGAHNINLVTPTPYIPHIRSSLISAKEKGLSIPIVYNSSGYESVVALKSLRGLVDIYLPDLKYFNDKYSIKYSGIENYFKYSKLAILEMYEQVGNPIFEKELLKKGLMLRHLLLPGLLFDSKKIIDWILLNLPKEVYLNIMCQYTPFNTEHFPEINKKVSERAYDAIIDYALEKGLVNGFWQEFNSASEEYVPSFNLKGL